MKSAVVDIETTALEGIGAGMLLCGCIRPLATKRTRTFRLMYNDNTDKTQGFLEGEERQLLSEMLEELEKYDLLIGHNIEKFDLPYLQSRAIVRGIQFRLRPFTYDTMRAWGRVKLRTVLNGYGKPTKSLDMIADFLGLAQLKTKIYPRSHWEAIWAKPVEREEALKSIIDHCERDVRMNAQIYELILQYDERGVIRRWM